MANNQRQRRNRLPYKYHGLVLDEFQAQAIWYLQHDTSTLVSAPTGTGKTLIADFLMKMVIEAGYRAVYTAPIKALVNQKYREFSRHYGKEKIGIITGDVSHQPDANIVVMTTEILRNMLLRNDDRLQGMRWVVFDEIHYLNHPERGTVWEEAILFLPRRMHLLGLSGTIPNAREVGDWIESIHEPVAVISHSERAVPLRHLYFNGRCQAVERSELMRAMAEMPGVEKDTKGGTLGLHEITAGGPQHNRSRQYRDETRHLDIISYVARNGLFPCIYFVFSRQGCEKKAEELAFHANYLNQKEKETVRVTVRRQLRELDLTPEDIPHFDTFYNQWLRGIAVHHAGLLPAVRQIAENLLERRILKVIYATETFAVGVNMPVRTVCFDTLEKYDGEELRLLTQQEYFQMAGRAGRRGCDKIGTVISPIELSHLQAGELPTWDVTAVEPIGSHIHISFNMVVNLLDRFTPAEVKSLLGKTLASFQQKLGRKDSRSAQALFSDFSAKQKLLQTLDYLDGNTLKDKGRICQNIYIQELLVTELVAEGLIQKQNAADLSSLAAAIIHTPRQDEPHFTLSPPAWLAPVELVCERLRRQDKDGLAGPFRVHAAIAPIVAAWANGASLQDILQEYPIAPGDFVTLCRQTIDLLRQIASVLPHRSERQRVYEAIKNLDRGVVRVNI